MTGLQGEQHQRTTRAVAASGVPVCYFCGVTYTNMRALTGVHLTSARHRAHRQLISGGLVAAAGGTSAAVQVQPRLTAAELMQRSQVGTS